MSKRAPKEKLNIPTRKPRPKGDMFANLRKPGEIDAPPIEDMFFTEQPKPERIASPNPKQTDHPSLLKIGLPKSSSLLTDEPLAYSKSSLPDTSSLPQNEQPMSAAPAAMQLMAALPETDGYTRLWHQMTDHLYRQLTPSEQAVHIQLFRLSWGHNKPTCLIGLPGLSRRAGVAKATVQRAVEGLIEKGLIEKVRTIFGKDTEQGIEYRVVPPSAQLKSSSLPKSSSLLKSSTNKETQVKETHTNTEPAAPRVSVNSKFELTECRKYADSLRKDGITNPGGYATRIHRSGEADELMEVFFAAAPVMANMNVSASDCPDCHGTGFYEPGEAGKGVARCKHERLIKQIENE